MKKKYVLLFFSFLISYYSFSQTWLWGNEAVSRHGGNGEVLGGDHCIATDKLGNAYFVGYLVDTLTFGSYTLYGTYPGENCYLVRYNSAGSVIWAKQAALNSGRCEALATAVALDNHDNVYVIGWFRDTVSFGAFTLISNNQTDVFLAKYDSSGNVLWAKQATSVNGDNARGTSVATDARGHAHITGYFHNGISFDAFNLTSLSSQEDIFTVEYDANGNVVWAKQSNSASAGYDSYSISLATDTANNVYITGAFTGTVTIGTFTVSTNSAEDLFLAKYDSGGNALWVGQASYNSYGEGTSIAVDETGNAYVIGYFRDSLSIGSFHLYSSLPDNVFLVKYNRVGNVFWVKEGISLDRTQWFGYSVSCDTLIKGGGYLTASANGHSKGIVFGVDTIRWSNPNFNTIPTIACQFDSSGNVLCSAIYTEGDENDYDCVTIDKAGKYIYIGGDLYEDNDTAIFGKDTLPGYPFLDIPYVARWKTCVDVNFNATATCTPTCKNICAGTASVTPLGGNSPYTYNWSNGRTTQSITGLCPGVYSVIIIDSSGYRASQSVTIIQDTAGGFTLTPIITDTTFCNKNISMAVSGGTAPFTYSWSNGATTSVIQNVATGNYAVKVTDGPGCVVTDSVKAPGSSAAMSFTDVRCDRDSSGTATVTITGGNSPYTYLWSNGATTQRDTGLVTREYYVTVTDHLGCATKDSVAISVYHAAPISVVPDSICLDSSAILTASGANTYKWLPSYGLSCYNCPSPTASPTVSTIYTVTGTDLHGCTSTAIAKVKVVPTPVPIILGGDSICKGSFITLTANGGSAYTWNPGNNTNSTLSVSPQVTTVYTLTASNGICSNNTTFTITVFPYPTATVTFTKDSVCSGDSLTLSGSGGTTYLWSPGNSTNATIHINPIVTTTYALHTYNSLCADSTTQLIKVIAAPVVSVSASADSICPSASATLTVTATGQATYRWSTGATSSSITVNPTVTTTYTATVYGTCDSVQQPVTVGIYKLPTPTITGKSIRCKGVSDTLTASGGNSYLWSNGSTSSTYITKGIDADSTLYVTVKNSHGCLAKDSFNISLIPPPISTFSSTPAVCIGQCITLTSNPNDSGYIFLWSNGATTDSLTVCPKSDSTFSIIVTNACGKAKASSKVNVYTPSLFVCCDTIIDKGNSVILTANNSTRYSWVPNTDLSCDTCQHVTAMPDVTTTYTVTSTDINGCTDVSLVTVKVEIMCFDFTVPNVFTPNGDGINDYFSILPQTLPQTPKGALNLDAYNITIYDRWGKEMYKSNDYTQSWNGNTEGGAQASDGVYYYIITATCQGKNYNKDGFVQLVR